METEADVSDPALKNELISDEAEAATDEVESPTETQVSDEQVSSEVAEIPYEGPTYSLEDMNEIRKWWEIPCVAHFCSLFRAAFDLPDFDIEELEEALLASGTPEGSMLMCDLISQLLNGCYGRNDIKSYNFEVYLRDIFKQRWQKEQQITNPLAETSFQVLTVRTKLELLQALCDFRLDADDVQDLLKGLDGDNLRVEPMGRDQNGGIYWYFYGVRLYKEDPEIKPDNTKQKKPEQKKNTKKTKTPVVKKKKKSRTRPRRSGRRKRASGRKGRSRKKVEEEDVDQKEDEGASELKAEEEMEVESTEPASVNNSSEGVAAKGQDGDAAEEAAPAAEEAAPAAGDDTPSRRSSRLSRRAKATVSPAVQEDTSEDDVTEEEEDEATEEEEEEEEPEVSEDNDDVPLSVLKKDAVPVDQWHLVCQSLEDWEELAENFKESKVRCEKSLYRTITEDFLPEIPRIMEEKERDMKRRALENAPRRTSCRLEEKQKQREEEEKLLAQMLAAEEKVRHAEEEERRKMLELEKLEIQKRQREEREKQRERMREERERAVERRAKRAALREEKARLYAERDRLLAEGLELPPELQNLDSTNGHRDDDEDYDKIDSEHEELFSGMRKILYTVKAHDDSWPFWEPVKEEFAPDYFRVVKTPMDLTMIEKKLDDRVYKSVHEFADDFQLLFENCEKYNGENSDFTYMARALQKIVNIRVKKLAPKHVHRYEVDEDFVPEVDVSPNTKNRPRRQAASHTMENIHAMMIDQDEEVESNNSKSNYTIVYPALKARGGDMRTAEGQARFLQALQAAKRKEAAEEFLRKGNTPQRSLMVQTNTINIPKAPERPVSIEDPVKGIIIQNNRNKMQLLAKTVNITSRYNGQQQKPTSAPAEDPELAALPMHKRIQEREAQKAKNKLSEPKAEPVTDSISVVRRHDVSRVYTELIQKTAKHTSHNKYSQGKTPQANISPKVVHISLDDFKRLQSQKAKVIVVPSGEKNKAGTVIHLSTGGIRTASSSPNAKSYIDNNKEEQKASPAQGVVPTKDVKVLEHSSDKITVLKTSPASTVAETPEKTEMEENIDETPDSDQVSEPPHTTVETPKTIMKTPKKTVFRKKVDEDEDAVKEEDEDSECPVPKKKRKSVSWSQNLTTESPYVPLPQEAQTPSPARSTCLYKDGIHRRVPRMHKKVEETVVSKDEEIGSEKTVINGMIVSRSALQSAPVVKTYSKQEPERKRSYESDFFIEDGPPENREPSPPKLTKIEQSDCTVIDHSEDAPPDIFSDPEIETVSSGTDLIVNTSTPKPSTCLYTYTKEKKKKLFPKDKETSDDSTCAKVVRRTKRSPHTARTTRRGRVSTPIRDDIVAEIPKMNETRRRGRPSSSLVCFAVQKKDDIDAEKKVKFTKVYQRNKEKDPAEMDGGQCDMQEPVLDLVSEANVEDFEEAVSDDVEMVDMETEAPAVDDVSRKDTAATEEHGLPEEGVEKAASGDKNLENEGVETIEEEPETVQDEQAEKEEEEKEEEEKEEKEQIEEEEEKEKEEEMQSEEDEVIQLEETASSGTQTVEVAEADGKVVPVEEEKEEILIDETEGEKEDQTKEELSQLEEGLGKVSQTEDVGPDTAETEQQECQVVLEEAEVKPPEQQDVENEVESQHQDAEVECVVELGQHDTEVQDEPEKQDAGVVYEAEPKQQEVEPKQQEAEVELQNQVEVEHEMKPEKQGAEVELVVEPKQQDAEVEHEVEPKQQDAKVEHEVEPKQQDAEVDHEVEVKQQDAEVKVVELQHQVAEVELHVELQNQGAEVEVEVESKQRGPEVEHEVELKQQVAQVELEVEPEQQDDKVGDEVELKQQVAQVELEVEPEQQDDKVGDEVESDLRDADVHMNQEHADQPDVVEPESNKDSESKVDESHLAEEEPMEQEDAEVEEQVKSEQKHTEVENGVKLDLEDGNYLETSEVQTDEACMAKDAAKDKPESAESRLSDELNSERHELNTTGVVKMGPTESLQTSADTQVKGTSSGQLDNKNSGSNVKTATSTTDESSDLHAMADSSKDSKSSDADAKMSPSSDTKSRESEVKTPSSSERKSSESEVKTPSSSERKSSESEVKTPSSSERKSSESDIKTPSSSDRKSSESEVKTPSSSERKSSESEVKTPSSSERKSSESEVKTPSSSERKSSDTHSKTSSSSDRSSDSHSRTSSSSDRRSHDSHYKSSSSRDRRSSDSHAKSSSSSDRRSSGSHSRSSSSRDSKSSHSHHKSSSSRDSKSSDSDAKSSSSRDSKSSASHYKSSSSRDRKSSDSHSKSSSSRDRRSSDSHSRSSSSRDGRSSDSHSRSSSSRDGRSSHSHSRSSSSRDGRSSHSHSRSSSSRDGRSSDSRNRSPSSRDSKSSDSHSKSTLSSDSKSSESHDKTTPSNDIKSTDSNVKTALLKDGQSVEDSQTVQREDVVVATEAKVEEHPVQVQTTIVGSSKEPKVPQSEQVTGAETVKRDEKNLEEKVATETTVEGDVEMSVVEVAEVKIHKVEQEEVSASQSEVIEVEMEQDDVNAVERQEADVAKVEMDQAEVDMDVTEGETEKPNEIADVNVEVVTGAEANEVNVSETHQFKISEETAGKTEAVHTEVAEAVHTEVAEAVHTEEAEVVHTGEAEAVHTEVAEAVHTEEAEAVQTEVAEAVHMEEAEAVHTEVAGSVHTEVAEAVQTEVAEAVHMEEAEAVHMEEAEAVHTEVAEIVHTEVAGSVQTEVAEAVHMEEAEAVHTEVAGSVHTEVARSVLEEVAEIVHTEVGEAVHTEVAEADGLKSGADQPSNIANTRKVETEASEDKLRESSVNEVDAKTSYVAESETKKTNVEVQIARETIADTITPEVVEDKLDKPTVPKVQTNQFEVAYVETDVVETIECDGETSVAENVSDPVEVASMEVEKACVESGDAVCGESEEFQSEVIQVVGEGSEEVVEEVAEEVVLVVADGDYVETRTECSADNVPAVGVSVSQEPLNSMETDVMDVGSCDTETTTHPTTMLETVGQPAAQDAKTSDEIIPMDTDCDEDPESKDQEISVQIIDDSVSADETGNCDTMNTGPIVSDSKSRDSSEMVEKVVEEPKSDDPPELDCCDPPVLERISPIDYKERSASPERLPAEGSGANQMISHQTVHSRSVNGTESDSKTHSESDSKELPVLSEQQKDDSGDFKSPSSDPVKKSCKSPVFSTPSELPVLQKHSPTKLSHTKSSSGKSSPENSSPKRSPTSSPPKQGVDRNVFSEFASNVNSSDSKTSPTSSPSKGSPNRPNLPIGFAASLSKLKDIGTFKLSSKSKTSDGSSSEGSS